MKPTQEQVIAWALEAGLVGKGQTVCTYADISDLELAFTLAYEAGRKDENEAAIEIVARHGGSVEIEAAIRARRQHG